jgi:hypothetical protein
VNGGYGRSGVKFLLWTQSFERFAGDRSFVMSPEFSFFFHTLLWAFIPWSLIVYLGTFYRIKEWIQTRFASFFTREQLTFSGTWVMFCIMSLSKFKLPHYINILFPMFAVFAAGFLHQVWNEKKDSWVKALTKAQNVIIILILVLMLVLNVWAFSITSWWIALIAFPWTLYTLYLLRKPAEDRLLRIWYPSAVAALLFNFVANTNFYPKIDVYQGDAVLGKQMAQSNINWDHVYVYGNMRYVYDYYSRHWQPILTDEQIRQKKQNGEEVLLLTNEDNKQKLDQNFTTEVVYSAPDYQIAGLSLDFINPKTRPQSLSKYYLVRIIASANPSSTPNGAH